ncbi:MULTISPECIES: phage regulatory CII family protein [Aliivibrio]|uniref:phage regulatory CII family protein n=1 Tax=Aliivibrio TaxID=511678 RepID=UPI0018C70F58|nr:phage regulatory CII family protein [Aliivibrio fischeri]
MNVNNSMCTLRESKQNAFNESCCAFSNSENVQQIAKDCGINPTMLRNKLNPSQPHKLTVGDLVAITETSGNYCIVNSVLLSLDMVAARVDLNADQETLIKRALENSAYAGDLSRMALENGGEIRLPRSKRNELLDKAHKSVSNLVLLMNDLENKTSGLSPFLSMSLDFVVNGAPIPGLS